MPLSWILLKWAVGSKFSTGAPMRMESFSMKSVCRRLIPERPAIRLLKNSAGFLPTGEMMPSPVMTTRLVMGLYCADAFLLGDDLVHQIDHVLQRFEFDALFGHGDLQFVFKIERELDHRQANPAPVLPRWHRA